METRRLRPVVALAALLAVAACERSKSANPLSPSVAGPIPGVEISAPRPLEPGAGSNLDASQQPLTLLIENAQTNGVRPLSYLLEVALDAGFSNKVYTRSAITPGEGGRTSLKLPEPLAAERTYYWRARAEDGANTGPFSSALHFVVFTPVVLEAPGLASPALNARLSSRTASLVLSNSRRSGPAGPITYLIQVATDPGFGNLVAQVEEGEEVPQTTKSVDLEYDTYYYWRARAWEPTRPTTGPWSSTSAFTTGPAPVVAPPPGGGGGGGAPGVYSTGPEVVEYVKRTYPERLVPTGSLSERDNNMAFLRDRIIETGICGGMDLAWNLKRGVGPHSIDALAWRHDGIVDVVDIGASYNDIGNPLQLQWVIVGGTPGYDGYSPRPSCK